MLIYDSVIYFFCGLLLAIVIFRVSSKFIDLPPVHFWLLVVIVGIFAVPFGFNYLPIDLRYDTSSFVRASAIGGISGVVGYFALKLFKSEDTNKKGMGNTFIPIVFAVIGFISVNIFEAGVSTLVGGGLKEIFNKDSRGRLASEITIQQLEMNFLKMSDIGPALQSIKNSSPNKFNKYISRQLEFMREAESEGKKGEDRYLFMEQKAAEFSSQIIPFLNDEKIYKVLAMSIQLFEEIFQADPRMCLNSSLVGFESKVLSERNNMEIVVEILGSEKGVKQKTLSQVEFELYSNKILTTLNGKHGNDIYIFIDPDRVSSQTAGKYCEIQTDFLREIKNLKPGVREAFFRMLIQIARTK